MLNAVVLTVLVSLDPSLAGRAVLLVPQVTAGEQSSATPDAGVAPEASAETAPTGEPAEAAPADSTGAVVAPEAAASQSAPAAASPDPAAAPGTGATASDAAPPAPPPELKGMEEPELQGMPMGKPWTGRIRYVWPFAKDHELLPGDVRIPLPVWLLAVGGGASVLAGVPFYTIARGVETQLVSGDDSIRTDADRARVLGHGRTMEAWGVGLWATGGVLVAASWVGFYVMGFQDKPKGLNASMSLGPQGGMVQLEWQLP